MNWGKNQQRVIYGPVVIIFCIIGCFNSLATEMRQQYQINNFKQILRTDILSISCETDLLWMPQDLTDD